MGKKHAGEHLRELAELYEEKRKEYKNAYYKHGAIMKALFPTGIVLYSELDFNRFALLDLMVVKLNRYSEAFKAEKTSPDSLDDLAVYSAMLREIDDEV